MASDQLKPACETVRLGDSASGRGVFSKLNFAAGDFVGEIRGMVIRDPVYESDYCMELDSESILEPTSPYCYLNHSCQPNCGWFVEYPPSDDASVATPVIWLKAILSIEPGHELTIDYAWPAEAAIACTCNSENCRGWIVAPDELDRLNRSVRDVP